MTVVWLGLLPSAKAATNVRMKTLDLPGVIQLGDVQASMVNGPNDTLLLDLNASTADCALLGWRHVPLAVQGTLQRDAQARWIFDGTLRLQANASAAWSNAAVHLLADQAANNVELELRQGESRFDVSLPMDQSSHLQIKLDNVPVNWLQGLATQVWAGQLTAGRLSAALALDVLDQATSTTGEFQLSKAAFVSRSGRLAGDSLNGSGRVAFQSNPSSAALQLDMNLRGGTLHVDSFDADLPGHAIQLSLQANLAQGNAELTHVQLDDPDALHLDGSFTVDTQGRLRAIRVDQFDARLPAAYQRYAQSWLTGDGFRDLRTAGQLSGSLSMQDGLPQAFVLHADGLDLADAGGKLAIEQLSGGLDWAARGNRPATTLAWRGMRIYRIAHGAAQGQWQSRRGELALLHPLSVPVLGGNLHVQALVWRPNSVGQRVTGSLDLAGVDMQQLSRLMDWPAMSGTLDGMLPALHWTGDRVDLDGGLSLHVFDGLIDVTHLSLQHPFGNSPQLSGDVHLKQLDLAALTDVFTMGHISGRLDGEVSGLRLLNWSPVAFDASLQATGGGKISQRAVNSVTSIGGNGTASGLQGAMLRLFKNFSYRRLGIQCVLKDAVCQMSGLRGSADGYTILEGSGFPRLQIVGHQQRVDWPILMRRLKAAMSGNPSVAR